MLLIADNILRICLVNGIILIIKLEDLCLSMCVCVCMCACIIHVHMHAYVCDIMCECICERVRTIVYIYTVCMLCEVSTMYMCMYIICTNQLFLCTLVCMSEYKLISINKQNQHDTNNSP